MEIFWDLIKTGAPSLLKIISSSPSENKSVENSDEQEAEQDSLTLQLFLFTILSICAGQQKHTYNQTNFDCCQRHIGYGQFSKKFVRARKCAGEHLQNIISCRLRKIYADYRRIQNIFMNLL